MADGDDSRHWPHALPAWLIPVDKYPTILRCAIPSAVWSTCSTRRSIESPISMSKPHGAAC